MTPSNILSNPRTTTAGALGVVFAAIGSQIIPALAAYFGAQPGIAWQLLGMALGAIPGAFMSDLAKEVSAAIDPPKPPLAPALLALLVGGLLFAAPARAQDVTVAPASHSFTVGTYKGKPITVTPGLGVSGYGYDFGTKSVLRGVTASGLFELAFGDFPIAALGAAGFQAGESQGAVVQGGAEYRPLNVALLYSQVVAGSTASKGIVAGYVIRF